MEIYRKSAAETFTQLEATEQGLTTSEVTKRQEKYGFNELKNKKKDPLWKLFLETFKDPMVIVLVIAALVQLVLGEVVESLIIFLVLIVNSIISVVQTRKAESSLDALREMSAPVAKVIRDGSKQSIHARELVPGDVVILDAGDFVPADGRLFESGSLKIDEGMLTGESEAVEKYIDTIPDEVGLGDRVNMVFSGSLVVYGRGMFVVTGTASETEIGKIAGLLETAEAKQTPLQRKLESFSKKLGLGILALCVLILQLKLVAYYSATIQRIWQRRF